MKQSFLNFDAAIFDLDGTLLNSWDTWKKIDIAFLEKRGIKVPHNYVKKICYLSLEQAAKYTIDAFVLTDSINEVIEEWNNMAKHEYSHNIMLMPYALEYLHLLKKNGIKIAIATRLPNFLSLSCLKNNNAIELFDVLCSTEDVACSKNFPNIFELVAKNLQVPPNRCIVFDDSPYAIKSAKQLNMIVYGVHNKYYLHQKKEITKLADGYIKSFKEAPLPLKNEMTILEDTNL